MEKYEVKEYGLLKGAVITACSLFAQWAHWFIYEKSGMWSGFLIVSPLALCFMYSLVMYECRENKRYSGVFIFVFSVVLPLLISFALCEFMLLCYPELSVFSEYGSVKGTPKEIISIYSGRIFLTSLYLLAYSAVDVLAVQRIAGRRKNKEKGLRK